MSESESFQHDLAVDDEEDWADEQAEDEKLDFIPICAPSKPQDSLESALDFDRQHFGFDLLEYLPSPNHEDFFEETIMCINKCRKFVNTHLHDENLGALLKEYLTTKKRGEETDDNFFVPILQEDLMIMCMDDLQDLLMKTKGQNDAVQCDEVEDSEEQLKLRIIALEEQLKRAKECITRLTEADNDDLSRTQSRKSKQDNDTYYFSSYSHSSIHETMLQDTIRTEAYQSAILSNEHLFKDKVVMDIGCGTGILSLFAAKAGARKVIAIDASDVHTQAREIVDLNGFGDVIFVVHGKVEELISNKKLPLDEDEKVDIVISEWMGYALLYETMLPSVMTARDKCMDKVNGTMWPNKSNMFIEGATDPRLEYWNDVYGMNMAPMKVKVTKELQNEASVEIVEKEMICTNRFELISFDLNKCLDKDLDFKTAFELKTNHETGEPVKIDKLVISFDVDFDLPESNSISFSTSCQTKPTHWKQTTLWFDPDNTPLLQPSEVLKGNFTMTRNDINQRDMDFVVTWEINEVGSSSKPRSSGTILSKLSS